MSPPPVMDIPPDQFIAATCARFSIAYAALVGPIRTKWLTKARREIAVVLDARGMGLKDIGRLLGRDHSSIHSLLGRRARKPKKKARNR